MAQGFQNENPPRSPEQPQRFLTTLPSELAAEHLSISIIQESYLIGHVGKDTSYKRTAGMMMIMDSACFRAWGIVRRRMYTCNGRGILLIESRKERRGREGSEGGEG